MVFFDASTSRVGIGEDISETPPKTLTVEGSISASGEFYAMGSASFGTENTSSASLTVAGNISASGHAYIDKNIYYHYT